MDTALRNAHIKLHIAVLLFGFTAILGELIPLSALVLVWWRVSISSGFTLLTRPKTWRNMLQLPSALRWRLVGIGQIVMLHWLCFYGAVKLSNASVTLICMGTTAFQAALFEPLLFKRRVSKLELGLGLLIVPGMALVASDLPGEFSLGLVVGLISAFFASIFSVLNKYYSEQVEPQEMTFIELGSGALSLTVLILGSLFFSFEFQILPKTPISWLYILILALLCTNLAYNLVLSALRHVSAFVSNLSINLEPVYGILLAAVLLGNYEELNPSFYVGSGLIVAAVFLYAFLQRRRPKA